MSQDEMQALAQQIAETLGEMERKPRAQITAIVKQCGIEFAQNLFQETLTIQAQGGMMLTNQSRQRTPGGVFFYLARRKMPRELVKVIFPAYSNQNIQTNPKVVLPEKPRATLRFNWDARLSVIQPLLEQQGVLDTVKVMLTGRPGLIDSSHKDLVITTMSYTLKPSSIPKGVPTPPEKPTVYTVYMSSKQWKKVEDTLANPEDTLIIEGSCAFDEQIGGIAVYAMNVSTKQLEAQKRQLAKESGTTVKAKSESASASQPPRQRREFDGSLPTPTLATATMPSVPLEVGQKLTELYASASLFRQKIATIQSKPSGQQFGLEMTQKLLKNVEDEIAAIEKKYQD
ncbi:MAG: phosphorylated adapter RNA export RNA-binding domain-containing protein [Chloroflexota bacterium]